MNFQQVAKHFLDIPIADRHLPSPMPSGRDPMPRAIRKSHKAHGIFYLNGFHRR